VTLPCQISALTRFRTRYRLVRLSISFDTPRLSRGITRRLSRLH
jgi:hypothetical protein